MCKYVYLFLVILFLLPIEIYPIGDIISGENDNDSAVINASIVHATLSKIQNSSYSTNLPNLVLFVKLSDFYCPHCVDDFLLFIDLLKSISKTNNISITMILHQNEVQSEAIQIHIMKGWKQGNNIPFPFYLDVWDIFNRAHIEKTSVLFLNKSGEKIIFHTFPIGWDKRYEIMRVIKMFTH